MNIQLHKELVAQVAKLKRVTSDLSIESIVNFVAMEQQNFFKRRQKAKSLSSPLRQGMYLLAIACHQDEPEEKKVLDQGKSEQIINILNSIFNKYAFAYFPEKREQIEGLSEKWHKDRQVAMPAFINFFASGFKISTDQIKSWISYYYEGFEDQVNEEFGISQYDMLSVGDYFESRISQNVDEMCDVISKLKAHHAEFVKQKNVDFGDAIKGAKENEELKKICERFYHGTNEIFSIKTSELEEKFGARVRESILEHFTTVRGKSEDITYITDDNPVTLKPLFSIDEETLYFVANNSFYQSIINNVEKFLSKGKKANSFLKARDKRLEEKTVEQFRRILPDSSEFYESAFETENAHFEHDLVIIQDSKLLIIEAKASPPREPLRDPSKAFVRINDHFKSNAGLQKAYNQAHSLEKNLRENGTVDIYDKKGTHLRKIISNEISTVYCICITRDDFGALATDLSLLLEKESGDNYPWAINISDLEFMLDGFLHLGMNHGDLYKYLDKRKLLHGKVFGTDELEFAGAFLNYGGLDCFVDNDASFIPLDISESNVFDDIYMAKVNGREFSLTPVQPALTEIDRAKLFNTKKTSSNDAKKKKTKQKQVKASKKRNRKK